MSEDVALYLTLDELNDLFADHLVLSSLGSGAQGFVFKVKKRGLDFLLKIYKPGVTIRAKRQVKKLKELASL